MKVWGRLFTIVLGAVCVAQSQVPATQGPAGRIPAAIEAVRATSAIEVDGILSESIWQRQGMTQLTQALPSEGASPSQKTEVWLAYDEQALYVAARMYDSAPDSIIQTLGRRDAAITADWFTFYVDPYHDHRSGFYFALSAAGSMQDGTLFNDDWDENTWDGVWEGKSTIDEKGWSMEMRIPYSQLRFRYQEHYVWGINFKRWIGRTNERDYLVYTPQKESGFVSRFVDLVGIESISESRQFEILPYVTSRAEYTQHAPNDPFNSGSRYLPGMGADLKVALGSNLTFNGTINPDFGQVEVDPAVVNLSDVETFFDEKRPFFIEGANTFRFGQGGSNSFWGFNWSNPTFFYSRRIGRSPQGSLPSYDYADLPLGTHILGAGKITGKVGDNWNIGMIHAVTAREFADIESGSTRQRIEVEPLTYYGIGRAQKDFNDGLQGLGFITTYTGRNFQDQRLRDEINSSAFVGAIDGWTFLDSEKTYVVTGWTGLSDIHANQTQMLALQQSSRHYFQRPDGSVHVDSSATSLRGYAGRFTINKQKGQMMLNSAIGIIDPSFDVNDLGFLWRTDMINYHVATGYKWTDRTEYYNYLNFSVSAFGSYDFGGTKTWQGYWTQGNWEFPNFYSVYWSYAYNPYTFDTRGTRGGPAMLNPVGWEIDFGANSDSRKPIEVNLFGFTYQGGGGEQYMVEVDLQYKPLPNINLTVGPSINRNRSEAQWFNDGNNPYTDPLAVNTYGRRYLFANLDQTTVAANIRLNWTFTPELSLQLFMQPLISTGKYTNPKEFLRPRSFEFRAFGENGSTIQVNRDQDGNVTGYDLDADGNGPSPTFTVSNPDFNFTSLRGNAVLRWEYRPGSTIYLVWTQSRSDNINNGDFQFSRSVDMLVGAKPDNIFLIKFSYWWNL